MIEIYVSTILSATFSILTNFRMAFDEYVLVNKELCGKNMISSIKISLLFS
ncbi:MAG: hypothetical protein NHB15_11850 [Methanosarcina barkeri]|nr:hypothetical protein [Methanosarcina sp. ERenArc_MAG2]